MIYERSYDSTLLRCEIVAKGFIRSVLGFSIPTVVSAFVAIVAVPLTSRFIPADEYAKANIFYEYGNLLALMAPMGIADAFIRFFHETDLVLERRRLYTVCLLVTSVVLLAVGAIVVAVFGPSVSKALFGSANSVLVGFLFLYAWAISCYKLSSYEARLEENVARYSIQQVAFIVTNRLLYVVPIAVFHGFTAGCLFLLVSTLLIGGISIATERKPIFSLRKTQDSESVGALMAYGLPLVLAGVSLNLMSAINKTALSGMSSFATAGVYSLALTIANVFSFVPAAFCTYWSVYMYEHYETERENIKLVHDFISCSSIVLVVGIFLFQDVLYAFVGPDYGASQPYFMLVMLWPVQSLLCETTAYGLNIKRKTTLGLAASAIAVVVDAAAVFLLVPRWGAMGAALAFALASVVSLALRSILGQKYYCSLQSPVRTIVAYALIVSVCALNAACWNLPLARFAVAVACLVVSLLLFKSRIPQFVRAIFGDVRLLFTRR